MVMETKLPGSGEFGFAFNDANFSDRLLRLEISGSNDVSCSSVVDLVRHRKRKREDFNNETSTSTNTVNVESTNLNQTTNNENNKDHGKALMGREEQSGGDNENESSHLKLTSPLVTRVKELHISSPILASKSPFFYKLFSNGMRESEQRNVTLSIAASEEVAVMELLNFMYTGSLSVTTAPALLEVLVVADKFEVDLCMKYCSQMLLNMPMTLDFALLLLELPLSIQAAASVEPLTNAARQFIASRYKNIAKFPLKEMLALPLVALQAIIASDDLQVGSEDVVYELVLEWVKAHYSVVEERQETMASLARYIRFAQMSWGRLKDIFTSDDFSHPLNATLVIEALFFKAGSQRRQRILAAQQPDLVGQWYVERAYRYRPIQTVEFEVPRQQCIVYLDLTHKECVGMHPAVGVYPSGRLHTQMFHLGGQSFSLVADCNVDQQNLFYCFGLYIALQESGSMSLNVEYVFSARSKPTAEFVGYFKGKFTFTGGKTIGNRNLFAMPWDNFMAKTCPFFINDVLHLRAELTVCH